MKKLITGLGLIVALLLTGCSMDDNSDRYVALYYINDTGDDLVKVYDERYPKENYTVETAIIAIRGTAPNSSVRPILKDGVKLLSASPEGKVMEINLNAAFREATDNEQLLMKAAIVRAVMIAKGVQSVRFFVEGDPLVENDEQRNYTMGSFIVVNDFESTESQRAEVIFYFRDAEKKRLLRKVQQVSYTKDNLEINTIRELVRGPQKGDKGLTSPFPAGLEVLRASTNDGICTVKFNERLNDCATKIDLDLAVYAVVNTLSSIPGIQSVQIYSGNEMGVLFQNERLYGGPLEKNEDESIVIVPKNNP